MGENVIFSLRAHGGNEIRILEERERYEVTARGSAFRSPRESAPAENYSVAVALATEYARRASRYAFATMIAAAVARDEGGSFERSRVFEVAEGAPLSESERTRIEAALASREVSERGADGLTFAEVESRFRAFAREKVAILLEDATAGVERAAIDREVRELREARKVQ